VWLVMGGLCGLIGFVIVYHYASGQRKMEHFAIVVDAGSTQTRSALFSIELDEAKLAHWRDSEPEFDQSQQLALTELLGVRQIGSCVNGGPLASVKDEQEAQQLLMKCLEQFTSHIKQLDFSQDQPAQDGSEPEQQSPASRLGGLLGGRVNSVTRLYVGATAGMRALQVLDRAKSEQIMHWLEQAIGQSNALLDNNSPFVNRAFVGIITGRQEATFGWISVNFLAERLALEAATLDYASFNGLSRQNLSAEPIYHQLEQDPHQLAMLPTGRPPSGRPASQTIGTLELGGASAQLAFEVAAGEAAAAEVVATSQTNALDTSELELFNRNFRLATRSDLCLGMSQAVLRVRHILLLQHLSQRPAGALSEPNLNGNLDEMEIEIPNVCLQNGARIRVARRQLLADSQGACLAPPSNQQAAEPKLQWASPGGPNDSLPNWVTFVGLGNHSECEKVLETLIEPQLCAKLFQLCPATKVADIKAPLSSGAGPMETSGASFVTISGYNHALRVLDLKPQASLTQANELDAAIAEKLGGQAVDYEEFVAKSAAFCKTHSKDLAKLYPKAREPFRPVLCMQLLYIDKLLTRYYGFQPASSWNQIKFLVFESGQQTSASDNPTNLLPPDQRSAPIHRRDPKNDIGWTLGLLLNSTSYQLSSPADLLNETIFFHHGSSVAFLMRSTVMLMVACCLLAMLLLLLGVLEVTRAQRRSSAYSIHHSSSPPPDLSNGPPGRFYTINVASSSSLGSNSSASQMSLADDDHFVATRQLESFPPSTKSRLVKDNQLSPKIYRDREKTIIKIP